MKSTSDILTEWLVLGCKQGDHKAFNLLVQQWQPKVLKLAYWHCKNTLAALSEEEAKFYDELEEQNLP